MPLRLKARTRHDHAVDVAPQPRFRGNIPQRHFSVAQDRTEDVVEVVRDAAREGAEGFQALRARELALQALHLILGALSIADVGHAAGPSDRLVRRIAQAYSRGVDPAHFEADDDTQLHFEARGPSGEMPRHRVHISRPVLGKERQRVDELLARGEREVGRHSENDEQSRRGVVLVFRNVPVIVAIVRGLHGERIALFGEAKRLLHALALRDVDDRAAPAHRFPRPVARDDAGHVDPAQLAARNDPDLHVEASGQAGEMRGDGLEPFKPVVRMECEPLEEILTRRERRLGGKAVHLQQPRRGPELVTGNVPIPVTLFGGAHRQRVALFRDSQRLLGMLALRDVADDPVDHGAPVVQSCRAPTVANPPQHAVLAHDPVLDLGAIGRSARDPPEPRDERALVLGMHPLHPQHRRTEQALRRDARDTLDGGRDVQVHERAVRGELPSPEAVGDRSHELLQLLLSQARVDHSRKTADLVVRIDIVRR